MAGVFVILTISSMKNEKKHYWMYVLKLEGGKYYVGVTSKTPHFRFNQHKKGFAGASWTKLHKPIRIYDTKDLGMITYAAAQKFENKVVDRYIKKYGINNVRGGDLRMTGNVVQRFGLIFDEVDYLGLTTVILLMLAIVVLVIENY